MLETDAVATARVLHTTSPNWLGQKLRVDTIHGSEETSISGLSARLSWVPTA